MTPEDHFVAAWRLLDEAADQLKSGFQHPDATTEQQEAAWDGRRLIKEVREILAPAAGRLGR